MESERPVCRALDSFGNPCDCEEFLAPEHRDPNDQLRCVECLHGPSKHPRPSRSSSTAGSVSSRLPNRASKETVLSIFEETVKAGAKSATPSSNSASSGSKKKKVDISGARKESLVGFRPKASREKASSVIDDADNHRIGWIAVLIDGLKEDGTLRHSKSISKATLTDLESLGCAKLGDINISEKWSYDDCTSYFAKILPRPFGFALNASRHTKATRNSTAAAAKPTWVLVTLDNRKLHVVNKDRPTGKDLWFHRCGRKSGPDEIHIIIALRKAVPKDVIQSWKPVRALDLPSSDIQIVSDAENVSDGQESAMVASGSEEDDESTVDDRRSEASEDSIVFSRQTGRKRRYISEDNDTPEDDKAPLKKQRLDMTGKGKATFRTEKKSKTPASTAASGKLANGDHHVSRRASAGFSSCDTVGVSQEPSLPTPTRQALCSYCATQKRVSPVPSYVEPEDTMDWNAYLGREKEQRHFLNPWDSKYEPLLIFL